MCSSAKAAPARSPTASSTARSRTRSIYGRKVLTEFVKAGAPPEILYVAKPHIGTFRLVTMVENMRADHRGAGRRDTASRARSTDLSSMKPDGSRQVRGVVLADGERIAAEHVVLAVGHSARDTFQMLYDRGVAIEAKPFSIGFRIEHPQSLIDRCRYGRQCRASPARRRRLQAGASRQQRPLGLQLLHVPRRHGGGGGLRARPRGDQRHEPVFAQRTQRQRGIVVGVTPDGLSGHPLAGIAFQRHWESTRVRGRRRRPMRRRRNASATSSPDRLDRARRGRAVIPAGRDAGRPCAPACPISPPPRSAKRCPAFERQLKAFTLHDAVMTGVETRTSSPIRIRRDASYQSINTRGLYPAGEGAGYAGGILSAGGRRHPHRRSGRAEHCGRRPRSAEEP